MKTFLELLEEKEQENKTGDNFFFVTDSELNQIEELLTTLENGEKVYDPIRLVEKARILNYWCEADYTDTEGGYVFEKL